MSRDEFDQDEQYQQWHKKYQTTATELPPQSIDARIVNTAHRALKETAGDVGIDTAAVKRAWYVPASYVAIVVISLSVVIKLGFEPEMLQMPAEQGSSNDVPSIESRNAAPAVPAISAAAPQAEKKREKAKSARALDKNKQQLAKRKAVQHNERARQVERKVLHESEASPATISRLEVDKERASREKISAGNNELLVASENNGADMQQLHINQMLKLLENRQFDALKQALAAYRKTYTGAQGEARLAESLLAWERENIWHGDK